MGFWIPVFGDHPTTPATVIPNAAKQREESEMLALLAEFRSWKGLNDDSRIP